MAKSINVYGRNLMEDKKMFMPPPPKALKRSPKVEQLESLDDDFFTEDAGQEEVVMTQKEKINTEKRVKEKTFDIDVENEVQTQAGIKDSKKDEKSTVVSKKSVVKEKRKSNVNWNVIFNWAGLVVSVGAIAVFLFLLMR